MAVGVAPAHAPNGPNDNPPGDSSKPSASKFIYGMEGFEISGVFGGSIDPNTGKVTQLSKDLFSDGLGDSNMINIAADPKGRFIYILKSQAFSAQTAMGDSGIGELKVDLNTGFLSQSPGGPVKFSQYNGGMIAVDGSGKFLYQPNGFDNLPNNTQFDVYAIDQTNGTLTKSTPASVPPVGIYSLASPDGRFLFNAGNGTGGPFTAPGFVQTLAINNQTGQLTPVAAPVSTGGSAGTMAITPDSKFLFVTNFLQGTIAVFSVSPNGDLAMIGIPISIPTGVNTIEVAPNGKFLYMETSASHENNDTAIQGFTFNAATGGITANPGAFVAGGQTVTLDLSGRFAYISTIIGKPETGQSVVLGTYNIDPSTGALTLSSTSPDPAGDASTRMVAIP